MSSPASSLLAGQRLLFGKLQCTKYTRLVSQSQWSGMSEAVKGLTVGLLTSKHPKGQLIVVKNISWPSRSELLFAHEWMDATPAELKAFEARKKVAEKRAEALKIQVEAARVARAARELKIRRADLIKTLRLYPQLHETALQEIEAVREKVTRAVAAAVK